MTIKQVIRFTHLWLGLISGLVVVIVSLTGCVYVFQKEIQEATQPYRYVKEDHSQKMLSPTVLRSISDKALPGKKIHSVEYGGPTSAAKAIYYNYDPEYYYLVYMNPYTGNVLKVKNMDRDFFNIILQGHYYLWLPAQVGKPVVAISTLIFVVLLITGIVLWWPRSRVHLKQSLTLKWNTGWKRRNYDLHNVPGFYIFFLGLILALTGLVWGFQWFANSVYWTASGGKTMVQYSETFSDTTRNVQSEQNMVDAAWEKTLREEKNAETIEMHFPETEQLAIAVSINPDASTYWKTDYRYYDQNTLDEIDVTHMYGRYNKDMAGADKLMRMNYDIHTGSILGFAGKLLAFFVSLICASLPITGFYIWWHKRKNTRDSLLTELD